MMSIASISSNVSLCVLLLTSTFIGDWKEWRGPARDGVSMEKGLPTAWSPTGQNLAWKVPYGGRSAPIVMNGRVYLQNTAEKGAAEQVRKCQANQRHERQDGIAERMRIQNGPIVKTFGLSSSNEVLTNHFQHR